MKSPCLILAAAFLAGQAAADGFRGEISGGYVSGSTSYSYEIPDYTPPDPGAPGEPGSPTEPGISSGSSEDYDGWMIGGRVYLDGVDAAGGPLRLAPFLKRASHVGAHYASVETDSGIDADIWDVDTRLVWNAWVAEASYGQADAGFGGTSGDADVYRAAVGYYVARRTQLRGAYETADGDGGNDTSRYVVDVTHVQRLSNGMTWSVNALAALVDQDTLLLNEDGTDLELTLDWFFNDNVGVGAQVQLSDRDESSDATRWEIYGDYWVTEKVALRLSYYDQDFDDLDVKSDAWTFEAIYRR